MRVATLLCFALLLAGCGSKPVPAPVVRPPEPDTAGVTFSKDIQPVFAAGCVPCHAAGGGAAKYPVTTYGGAAALVKPGNPDSSKLYQILVEGKMPPSGRLDSTTLAKVREWIVAGARND